MPDRRIAATSLAVLVGLFGPMLVLASAQTVPLAVLIALASALVIGGDRPLTLRVDRTVLAATFLSFAYLLLADLWTPLGANAERALRAGGLIAAAALFWAAAGRLAGQEKDKCINALLGGILFALFWLAIERLSDNWLLRQLSDKPNLDWWWGAYNRAINVLSVVGPVAAAGVWRRNRIAGMAVGLIPLIAGMFMGASGSAVLAGAVGPVVALAGYWRPRLILGVIAVGLFAGALAGPVVLRDAVRLAPAIAFTVDHNSFSFQHRLITWHYTAERIAERPLLGWGARAARDLPDAELDIYSYTDRIDAPWMPLIVTDNLDSADVMPLHPHNALLQARLELGLAGTVLILMTVVLALHRATKPADRLANAALLGSVAAALTIWCLSVGLWQNWWIASVGVVVALTRLLTGQIGQK